MAVVGRLPVIFINQLLLSLLLCLHFTTLIQGAGKWEDKYPFIREASTFSSSDGTNNESNGNNNKKGGYDYIIVGGGTAGCPLANTLSQKFRVLLVERGGVPFANANVSFMQNFHISLADTSSTSASQYFVSTDGVFNSRARILGGGTCINAGFYTRAGPSYIQKVGWDSKLVNESYPWIERQIVHRPNLAPWQEAVRESLLEIGISPFNGFTYDHIYGTKVGGTIFDRFGRRHTAAELLATANPKNLDVLVHATVQKIDFDTSGKKPRAVGVIFKDENGKQHKAVLSKRKGSEIIVSCGAIGSPHILMLSGIGPKAELEKLNIPVVLDNKFVGQGMSDNPLNTIFVPTNRPVEQSLIQTVGITKVGVYVEASSGFGQSGDSITCNHGVASAEIGQLSTIPPKQRTLEAIEAFRRSKKNIPHEAFRGGFILEKIASPLSRGNISLVNTNPDDNPSITFNYFSHPRDLKRCVDGIRIVEKIAKSKHFTNYTQCDKETLDKLLNMSIQANVNLIPKHTHNTESLEQFCKDTVITIWHYHGGCHVGKVIAPDHRVLGVNRLRVIDGSTFKESPGTNPQATVMMMGRYMGVKILRERLGSAAGL
ncbi:Protein HOTHEAD [Capsicum annuum]|uniref:Protein HOTHEAD n=1 Tax=Capsicum annuum TaxID=4072 RepID=A0A1U8FUQ4_CAPAN|nr:protein HOTHEAD [Capsicum annuum]KAF3647771.1 Protein HOTHEAD [Capsicum annuum]PHT62174.1 Protein HOTHEAD [Capsicum annuum]